MIGIDILLLQLVKPGKKILDISWNAGYIHYFTMKKFCWLFESQGFRIEKRTENGFLAKFRNWWLSLLTGDLVVNVQKIRK